MSPSSTNEKSKEAGEWHVISIPKRLYTELLLISDEKKCSMDEALEVYIKRVVEEVTKTIHPSCYKEHLPDGFYYSPCQICGEMFTDVLVLRGSEAERMVRDRHHKKCIRYEG